MAPRKPATAKPPRPTESSRANPSKFTKSPNVARVRKVSKSSKATKPSKPSKSSAPPIKATKTISPPKPKTRGIFHNKTFVLTGDFGPQNRHCQVEKWIVFNGGRVGKKVTEQTTHLICSLEDFKAKVEHVREAWVLGKVRCKIMHIDFILDSLLGRKPKLVREKEYELLKVMAGERKEKKIETSNIDKDCWQQKELANPTLYRVYFDSTFFEHKVVLTRDSLTANGKPLLEKFTIYLYQSYAIPHDYMSGFKYKKGHIAPVLGRDKCVGKSFTGAFADFKDCFKKKTGVEWDQRLDSIVPKKEEYKFVYVPPSGGKPVGELPEGYLRNESKIQEMEEREQVKENGIDGKGWAADEKRIVEGERNTGKGKDEETTDPGLRDDCESGDDWG